MGLGLKISIVLPCDRFPCTDDRGTTFEDTSEGIGHGRRASKQCVRDREVIVW